MTIFHCLSIAKALYHSRLREFANKKFRQPQSNKHALSDNSEVIDNKTNVIGFIVALLVFFFRPYCSEDLRYLNVGEKIEMQIWVKYIFPNKFNYRTIYRTIHEKCHGQFLRIRGVQFQHADASVLIEMFITDIELK